MDSIGLDLGKSQSQIAILTPDGELIERRIQTEPRRFEAVLGRRAPARILIESSTESEWVARCLEGLGHEVIVADPNYAPMYAQWSRRVKTDRRDARALAEACRLGAYRPVHRTSDAMRHVRAQLAVRDALVRTRTRYISVARALLRAEGLRIRSGAAETFPDRLENLELPANLQAEIRPLRTMLEHLRAEIERADAAVEELVRKNEAMRRLCTVPSVGPITAASFVATIDTAERFQGAHQVQAYLGLVPREMSSGEKQHKGRITKAGNNRTRWLLVEAAWGILLRTRRAETAALRGWAQSIATRRGRLVAVVALARRLAGILYAMMRDGTVYQPERLGAAPAGIAPEA